MYRNKKKVLDINRKTRLNDDYCEKEDKNRTNHQSSDYKLKAYNDFDSDHSNTNRNNYMDSLGEVGLYHSVNNRPGHFIDKDSFLRNGREGNIITTTRSKATKQLFTRPHVTVPYMGAGKTSIVYPDVQSVLVPGESTKTGKSGNSAAGVSIDRFVPLVPCLQENVQNTKHIIPKYWVRGGQDTRSVIRNIDYMRCIGIKQ